MPNKLFGALATLVMSSHPASAEDATGHAQFHKFYNGLHQPGSGASCCNGKDCRPVPYRVTPNGVELLIAGLWVRPPAVRTLEIETPDGGAHWCGIETKKDPITFCAIIPRSGV